MYYSSFNVEETKPLVDLFDSVLLHFFCLLCNSMIANILLSFCYYIENKKYTIENIRIHCFCWYFFVSRCVLSIFMCYLLSFLLAECWLIGKHSAILFCFAPWKAREWWRVAWLTVNKVFQLFEKVTDN